MDSIFSAKLSEAEVLPGSLCGEDLEYTPAFVEFMAHSSIQEERQVGDHVIPAKIPDWREVFNSGCALLEKSRDLRILVRVCQAALNQYGLPGLSEGLALMAHWMEAQWDDLHPGTKVDGESDPLPRSNAIAEIADPLGLVHTLRETTLLQTAAGEVTVSAADLLLNGNQPEKDEIVTSLEQLSQMAIEEQSRNQDKIDAVIAIHASLSKIKSIFEKQIDSTYWPNIDLLTGIFTRLQRFISSNIHGNPDIEALNEATGQETSDGADGIEAGAAQAGSGAPSTPTGFPARLHTRADAFKMLAVVRKYFEEYEPSHPAPLLIRRIERLANLGFQEIVQELTPEGLKQLQTLAGLPADNG